MSLEYVEDVITICRKHIRDSKFLLVTSSWHVNFVDSLWQKVVSKDRPLTTEQGKSVVKLLAKARPYLVSKCGIDEKAIDTLLKAPRYRQPPTLSANIPREVRGAGGSKLIFRFKWNDVIRSQLADLATAAVSSYEWDWINRVTVVEVTPQNVDDVQRMIVDHRFDFDINAANILASAHNLKELLLTVDPIDGEFELRTSNFLIAAWTNRVLGGREVGFQTFRLPATPKIARRLLPVKNVFPKAVIDPQVNSLADEDTVPIEVLPVHLSKYHDLLQKILDYDVRVNLSGNIPNDSDLTEIIRISAKLYGLDTFVQLPTLGGGEKLDFGPNSCVLTPDLDVGKIRDSSVLVSSSQYLGNEVFEFPHVVLCHSDAILFDDYPLCGDTVYNRQLLRDIGFDLSQPMHFLFNTIKVKYF